MFDASELKTFKINNRALASESLPSRLKVFGWGDNQSTDGVFRAGDKTSAQLSANQKRFGYERVAIDFDHCTVPGHATQKELLKNGQPPLVFGYGRVNAIAGDGIYLEDITWTPLGVQHAKNFEDLSPALKDENGEVTMIHSVALTPNGKIDGLQFFSATTTNHSLMKNLKDPITGETLAIAVGLKADATPQMLVDRLGLLSALSALLVIDASGAIKAFSNTNVFGDLGSRLKTLEDAGTRQVATLSATIDGRVHTFSAEDVVRVVARVDKLEGEIKAGRQSQIDIDRDGVVKSFAADGKVPLKADRSAYTADELRGMDLGVLRILSANTPVTVALSARNAAHQTEAAKSFRYKTADGKEQVDLAALFEAENARAGLSRAPNI